MGFTPREIDQMSLWEFAVISYAFAKSQGATKPEPPSDEELDEVIARGF